MRRRTAALAMAFVIALPLFGATSTIPDKKRESIHTLLELTGMVKVVDQMIDQMFDAFAKQSPSVPSEAWTRLKKKMRADDLVEEMMPVYDKYYTQEDLDVMIAFYRTPVGQKVIRTLPDVSREGFQIGQAWGLRKADEVLKELKAEGLLKD